MGTRGAYGFLVNGEEKIAYSQFDSYPSGMGMEILDFIKETDLKVMKEAAAKITLVSNEVRPTPEQIKKYSKFADLGVSEKSPDDWYCLLRHVQGDLTPYTEDGLDAMMSSKDFLFDSLFCEWAYIINLDTGNLEVYKGFNKDPKASGRYADHTDDNGYCGVRLLKEIPLKEIQAMEDFLALCTKLEGEEEPEEEEPVAVEETIPTDRKIRWKK